MEFKLFDGELVQIGKPCPCVHGYFPWLEPVPAPVGGSVPKRGTREIYPRQAGSAYSTARFSDASLFVEEDSTNAV